jgi:hypothetical protein
MDIFLFLNAGHFIWTINQHFYNAFENHIPTKPDEHVTKFKIINIEKKTKQKNKFWISEEKTDSWYLSTAFNMIFPSSPKSASIK